MFWHPSLPELSGAERAAVYDEMNHVLAAGAKEEDAPVKEVLFTSFIIQ